MKKPSEHTSFLGRGWSFPPAFDAYDGSAEMVAGQEDVQQAIQLILSVTPGERQMFPEFGCNLRQFVFGGLDASTITMMETEVRSALLHFEPRIDVDRIVVTRAADNTPGAVVITIDYRVRDSNRRYNLVYPYYLNEATAITA